MAANDDFPRGLTLNTGVVNGATAAVQFPAVSGVAWVLTDIDVVAYANVASTGFGGVITTSLGSAGPEGIVAIANGDAAESSGEYSWHGQAPWTVGSALSVQCTGAAGTELVLTATAYPI